MLKKLKNYNSFVIGIFFIILVASSYFFVQYQLNIAIQKSTEAGNAVLTRVFVNETWSEISPLLPEPGAEIDVIKSNPNLKAIDSKIRRFISYTDVMKVKLYNVKGLTVYSSEVAQIGEDKSKNPGFQDAVRGNLASELIYRGHFGAFDSEIYNRNLVSTYAPIRDGNKVIAVAEIYSDRTSSIQTTTKLLNKFIVFLIVSCLFLYLIILYIYKNTRIQNQDKNQDLKLFDSSMVDEALPLRAEIPVVDKSANRFSAQYLKGIYRLAHVADIGSRYQIQGKIDSQFLIAKISDLSSSVSASLALNNLLLSLENEKYVHTPQVMDLKLFVENLKLYVGEQTNLDADKIHFYLSEDESINLYQDATLLNHLFRVTFDFLSEIKFTGVVQIKTFSANSAIEIMTVIEFGNDVPDDFYYLTDFFKRISNYLYQSAGVAVDVRLSGHSAFIDLKLQSIKSPLIVSQSPKKIGLLIDNELDLSLVKLMLEEARIQFVVVDNILNVEQLVKNDNIDFLIIDAGYFNRSSDLFKQLSKIINDGLLLKNQILFVQPSCCEFDNSLNLPSITFPFSPESLYQKLNVSKK